MMNCGMEITVVRIDGVRGNSSITIEEKTSSVDNSYINLMTVNAVKWINEMLKGIEHQIKVLDHPYGGQNEMGIRVLIPGFNEHDYIIVYLD